MGETKKTLAKEVIEKTYEPAPEKIIEYFRRVQVTHISDAMTRFNLRNTRMWGILPFVQFEDPAKHIAGVAVTMRFLPCHYKERYVNSPYKHTLFAEAAPRGSVIVIESSEAVSCGERSALQAKLSGVEAVVSDGPLRDVDGIRKLGLPMFIPGGGGAYGIKPETYVGNVECVGYQEPIYCGLPGRPGAEVRPNDIVAGDNNGVVVVPREKLDEIFEATKEIEQNENAVDAMIRSRAGWDKIYEFSHGQKYHPGKWTKP